MTDKPCPRSPDGEHCWTQYLLYCYSPENDPAKGTIVCRKGAKLATASFSLQTDAEDYVSVFNELSRCCHCNQIKDVNEVRDV